MRPEPLQNFFSRELLGCDLWFLGKASPSRRVEYNAKKKILLTLKFKVEINFAGFFA